MNEVDDAAVSGGDNPTIDFEVMCVQQPWLELLTAVEDGLLAPPYADDPAISAKERARRFACRLSLFCELIAVPTIHRQNIEQAFSRISELRDRVSPKHWDRLRSIALSRRMRELTKEIYDAQGH
jgi:hypothetical protein